ncbi:aquaporin-4-like isoform X1 [Alosa alosa]|uniref:aquaporin-4-like isoform X1 n=1 Tax=Alosa alosa TaxID=278164 RepID=UPI0020153466|nr:aquaporin-4-like isoform X1 [Alosa alosa]
MCGSLSSSSAPQALSSASVHQRYLSQSCPACPPSCTVDRIMVAFKGIWTKDFWRAVSAEFLATLIFVLLSVGSTINWAAEKENQPPADLVLISLCFGLSIATMVQCFGHISGGHINPAVTAAMVATRKLSLAKAVFYVAAQCLGATAGAGILYLVTPSTVRGSLGVTSVNPNLSAGHALVVELFITFELVFTVFATCDLKRNDLKGSAGLAIGLAVCIGHLFAVSHSFKVLVDSMPVQSTVRSLVQDKNDIPYTGASMNPARSFGPVLVTWNWENHWVYWVGPLLGGILAAALYEYLFCPDPAMKKRLSEMFIKDPSGKYKEVECPRGQYNGEPDDLVIKPGSFLSTVDKKEKEATLRESPGEVLSSV